MWGRSAGEGCDVRGCVGRSAGEGCDVRGCVGEVQGGKGRCGGRACTQHCKMFVINNVRKFWG